MNADTAVTDQVVAIIDASSRAEARYIAALLWGALMAMKPTTVSADEILAWLRSQLLKNTIN